MGPAEPPRPLLFFLDSSAIVNGVSLPPAQCRTTPSVLAEFQPGGATRRRLENLLAAGLEVREPTSQSLRTAQDAADRAGSRPRLSRTDLEILALALDGGAQGRLVTDDYTVQDLARRLGLQFQTVATRGVTGPKDWGARCSGCGRSFPSMPRGDACPVCGSPVKLKPKAARTSR